MKKQKLWQKLFALTMLVAVFMTMTACGSPKEALTAKQFQDFMEEKGLTVSDQTQSAGSDDYQNVLVAVDLDKYSFEYYFMRSDSTAKSLYTFAVEQVKKQYDGVNGTVNAEKVLPSTADFSLSASDYYVRVIRVDNAVLFVTAYPEFKDECKSLIDELGY